MALTYESLLLPQVNYLLNNAPQLLSTTTLSATTASVTYTVVTQYPRVLVAWRAMCNAAATSENMLMRFNGDSGSNYLWQDIQGSNSSANANAPGGASSSIATGNIPGTSATANYFSSGSVIVDGCTQGSTFMTMCGTSCCFITTTSSIAGTYSGQYNVATQLSSITLLPSTGSFVATSQFSFYGLS